MPQVRDEVLQRLDRWSQADLPAVVDFLLATVTNEDAARVVAELRQGINLTHTIRRVPCRHRCTSQFTQCWHKVNG